MWTKVVEQWKMPSSKSKPCRRKCIRQSGNIHKRSQGGHPPQISGISCRFVLESILIRFYVLYHLFCGTDDAHLRKINIPVLINCGQIFAEDLCEPSRVIFWYGTIIATAGTIEPFCWSGRFWWNSVQRYSIIYCRFVFCDVVCQKNTVVRLKSKKFGPPNILGWLRHW